MVCNGDDMRSAVFTRMVMAAVIAALVTASAVFLVAQTGVVSAGGQSRHLEVRQAHQRAQAGEIVLVDVRRPGEWRASGVPASAHAITMHQNGQTFIKQLLAATGGDKSKPLALICATGARTTWLQSRLHKAGFTNLINVTEGMMGSRYGPGWLKKGLPIRKWTGPAARAPR